MMKITILPDIPYGDSVSITNEIIDVYFIMYTFNIWFIQTPLE